MPAENSFTQLLKAHAQELRSTFDAITAKPSIPYDMGLKNLMEEFTTEFSTKTPGFFPGQIGPKRLIEYYHQFNQNMPGFSGRAVVQSPYPREVVTQMRAFLIAVRQDLQNPSVTFPWLVDKLGSLFVRGSVRERLLQFVEEKINGLEQALS